MNIPFEIFINLRYRYVLDIDECKVHDICPPHSTCINFEGSYICACNDGFAKNDTICSGKDTVLQTIHNTVDEICQN